MQDLSGNSRKKFNAKKLVKYLVILCTFLHITDNFVLILSGGKCIEIIVLKITFLKESSVNIDI